MFSLHASAFAWCLYVSVRLCIEWSFCCGEHREPFYPLDDNQDFIISQVFVALLLVLGTGYALQEFGGGTGPEYTRFMSALNRADELIHHRLYPAFVGDFHLEVVDNLENVTTLDLPESDGNVARAEHVVEGDGMGERARVGDNGSSQMGNSSMATQGLREMMSTSSDSGPVMAKGGPLRFRANIDEGGAESDEFMSAGNPLGLGIGRFSREDGEDPEASRGVHERGAGLGEVSNEVLPMETSSGDSTGYLPTHSADESVGSLVDFVSDDSGDPAIAMIRVDDNWSPRNWDLSRHVRKGGSNSDESAIREERKGKHKRRLDAQKKKHQFTLEVINDDISLPQTTNTSGSTGVMSSSQTSMSLEDMQPSGDDETTMEVDTDE